MGSYLDKLLFGIRTVLNNGSPLPFESTINLIGFTSVVDNPGQKRIDVTAPAGAGAPGFGAPIQSSGGTLTLTATNSWGLVIAADTILFPATPTPGQEFVITHDQLRSTASLAGGGQLTFGRAAGGTYSIQDPDGRKTGGGAPLTGTTVHGTTDGATYRFAFDGNLGVMRCISSLSSP